MFVDLNQDLKPASMDQPNLLIKSWQEQKSIFIDNLAISRKRPTKAAAHDIRVSMKKMRSYLRLTEPITGLDWKQVFAGTKKLFRSFGRLRDFEMSIALTRTQEKSLETSFGNFKKYLIVNRSLMRKWVKQDTLRYDEQQLNGLTQKLTLSFTNEELIGKITDLSGAKIKKARQQGRHFQKKAHKIRKELKDAYYWLRICPPEIVENIIAVKELDKMLGFLGKWQDHFILKKKIDRYLKDFVTHADEEEALKNLQTSLTDSQDKLLQKAKDKWKKQ